jgi:hypothetical protein
MLEMCRWAEQSSSKSKSGGEPFKALGSDEFRLLAAALRTLHVDGHAVEGDVKQLLSQEAAIRGCQALTAPLVVRKHTDRYRCVLADTIEMIVEVKKGPHKRQTWTIVTVWKLRTSFTETLQTKGHAKKVQAERRVESR